jgi:methyl-accepting chemotaxis protein
MNSLKTKFFLFFTGLAVLTSFGAGIVMYIQYMGYIKSTYWNPVSQVLQMLEKQYPALSDPEALIELGTEGSDEYWNMVYRMNDIAQIFGFAYIYYVRSSGDTFQYVFSSEEDPSTTPDEIFLTYEPSEVPPDIRETYTTKKLFISSKAITDEWGTFISGFIPIFNGSTCVGVLGVDYSISTVKDIERIAVIALLVSLGLSGIVAGILGLLISRSLIKPIKEVEGAANALAALDFEAVISHFRKDEIGDIQRALIKIRDSLRKAMDDLKANLSNMSANSKRLNTVIVESSDALGTITGNMDVMQTETDTQRESVAQTSNALNEIINSIDSLDKAVYTQAAHITQSSAAIEEMVANIASIRLVVAKVTKTTDTLSRSSASGHSMLIKLTEAIKRIQDQSATLQNANKTIADIVGQTNILAMNAAIEAAHAGESGKGFAVVAGEIRKLAELSGKESNAISEEITKIKRGIEQITRVSNQTVGAMDTIFTEIKAMDESFTQVNHAVEEQSAGGSQILIALEKIQDMTGQVREGAKTIQQQSGSIHEEMGKLERISQNVTKRVYEVKLASGSIASLLENTKDLHRWTADTRQAP